MRMRLRADQDVDFVRTYKLVDLSKVDAYAKAFAVEDTQFKRTLNNKVRLPVPPTTDATATATYSVQLYSIHCTAPHLLVRVMYVNLLVFYTCVLSRAALAGGATGARGRAFDRTNHREADGLCVHSTELIHSIPALVCSHSQRRCSLGRVRRCSGSGRRTGSRSACSL